MENKLRTVPVYRLFVKTGTNMDSVIKDLRREDNRLRWLFAESKRFNSIVMVPGHMPGTTQTNRLKFDLENIGFHPYVSSTHSVRSTLMNLSAQVVAQRHGPDTVIGFFNPAATASRITPEVADAVAAAFEEPGVDEVGVWAANNPAHAFVACGFAEASCHFIRARAVLDVPYNLIADDPAPGMPEWQVTNTETGASFRLHGAEDSQRIPKPESYAFVRTDGVVYRDLPGFGGDTRIQDFKVLRAFLNSRFAKIGRGIEPTLLPDHSMLVEPFRSFVRRHLDGVHPTWRTKEVEALASRFELPNFVLSRVT